MYVLNISILAPLILVLSKISKWCLCYTHPHICWGEPLNTHSLQCMFDAGIPLQHTQCVLQWVLQNHTLIMTKREVLYFHECIYISIDIYIYTYIYVYKCILYSYVYIYTRHMLHSVFLVANKLFKLTFSWNIREKEREKFSIFITVYIYILCACIYIYMYTYIYTYIYTYVYTYIYI